MSTIEFVDVATARAARGVRLAAVAVVPSPWSEAAKGLFRVANVPVLAVRAMPRNADVIAWAGVDNAPVVFHDDEPPRTNWVAITTLADRLGGPGVLLPTELAARIATIGLLHEIAGEDGIGWRARLAMIDASIKTEGKRGFPLSSARYLAKRYGYTADAVEHARPRMAAQLALLRDTLRMQHAAGHAYFGGARPSAVDVYCATFLTPLGDIPDTDCPGFLPAMRAAFATALEMFGELVAAELVAHRKLMFERHLAWPIAL